MKTKTHKRTNSRSAFTLIELLTVIAVISVLAAILIPAISAVRKKSNAAEAISNARQIGMANLLHSQENNGEVFGRGWDNWNDTLWLVRGLGEQLSSQPDKSDDAVAASLAGLIDPSVPEELQKVGRFPFTWSINYILNVRGGRVDQGVDEKGEGGSFRPRRMIEFEEPAETIFAVSGNYQITPEMAENAELLGEPQAKQRIYYLYGSNDQTPAVFLDGHAEMLTFPIDPNRINPSLKR